MPGLVPGIHVFEPSKEDVDGRDKPGHDVLKGLAESTFYCNCVILNAPECSPLATVSRPRRSKPPNPQ
jgi:hypothetical protein